MMVAVLGTLFQDVTRGGKHMLGGKAEDKNYALDGTCVPNWESKNPKSGKDRHPEAKVSGMQ